MSYDPSLQARTEVMYNVLVRQTLDLQMLKQLTGGREAERQE